VTTLLIAIPLVAAAVLVLLPLDRRQTELFAIAAMLVEVVVGAYALTQFDLHQAGQQFVTNRVWIQDFGLGTPVRYHVGMDGLSLFMVLLSSVGIAAAAGSAMRAGRDRPRAYFGLLLLLEAALVLLFTAQDLVLFYVGWEVMLIPLFVLMAVWGGEGRRVATVRFVIYTMVGSLLMLVAIAAIGVKYGTFEVSQVHSGAAWIFFFFAAAFCIKAPMFPLHGWMPAAYRESSPETTALLSGVISKAGAYGLLRFCLPMFPGPAHDWRWLFLGLGLAGLLYASLLAFRQADARGVVAYSSLGQMNLIIIGIFALNANGSTGAIFQMVNHGLVSLAAFLVIGLIELRAGTDGFRYLGGLANNRPRFSTVLLITTMFMLAVPGSSVFVSEIYILIGAFQQQAWLGAVAACAIVLAAMYALRWFSALAHEDNGEKVGDDTLDLRRSELLIAVPIIVLLLAMTAYPFGVMNRIKDYHAPAPTLTGTTLSGGDQQAGGGG
jgi:NADH-quinone oxidoreductase subunit M